MSDGTPYFAAFAGRRMAGAEGSKNSVSTHFGQVNERRRTFL